MPPAAYSLFTLGELRLVGPAGPVLAGRRKELVLLTCVARRTRKAVSRDELAALLWGDRDEDKARQSLRHALHQLRRTLDDAIEITNDDVRVADAAIDVDASLLERDITEGRLAEGVERYKGDFLPGAEDAGSDTYRAWLERERESLRRITMGAFARLVDQARSESSGDNEVHWARRWAEHFPHDDAAHVRLVDALSRRGEVDQARAVHAAFIARLRDELELAPSAELIRLGDQVSRATAPERERRRGAGAIHAPELVGRGVAIAASLMESWSRAAGEGSAVVIAGEEGTGKTRLCADLVRRVRASGQPALILETSAADDEAWSTVRRLMHALIGGKAIEDAPAKALAELSGILPALRERFPHLAQPSGQPDRIEASLRDVLKVVGAKTPLLLIVDDFGRADSESRRLIRALLTSIPRGTMVVLTLRSDTEADLAVASDLGELPGVRRFQLATLSAEEVGALVDSMLDVAPATRDALSLRLHSESGGNPARITALVSKLTENGTLSLSARGTWELAASAPVPVPSPARRRPIGAIVAGAAIVAAVAAIAAFIALRPAPTSITRDASAAPEAPRIAVLDLELLSRDTLDAYLASGLAEEINASLSRYGDLRIKSRGAVATVRAAGVIDPVQLGKAMDVDYLLEGNVRRGDQRFTVGIRLTKTSDGFQVWSDDFDAATAGLPSLHDRIAREVATRIGSRVTTTQLSQPRRLPTADPQAYEHYLRGNYYLARRTPATAEQAISLYRLAMSRDPKFAAAQARIAYAYAVRLDWGWAHAGRSNEDIVREGLELVQAAMELDSLSADAWMARAYLLTRADPVRMRGAIEAFDRAIALDPRNVEAIHQLAQVHETQGNWDQALSAFRRTLLLEPDRSLPYVAMASIEWKRGAPKVARRLYDSALVVDPGASYALSARALLRIFAEDDVKGGLEDAETAVRVDDGYSIPPHSVLAIALANSGSQVRAELEVDRALSELVDPSEPSPTDARFLGSALLAVGRRDDALNLLERVRPRGAWLWFYCLAPDFDAVRKDPRFVRIMREAKPD